MIERVLEAYVEKTSGKGSLWEKLDKMNSITKIIFWVSIFCGVIILISAMIFQSPVILFVSIAYVIIVYILTNVLERERHKKWEVNLKKYNNDLDV